MRDSSKIIALGRAVPALSRSRIQVYSSAGEAPLLPNVTIISSFISSCVLRTSCILTCSCSWAVGPRKNRSVRTDRGPTAGRAQRGGRVATVRLARRLPTAFGSEAAEVGIVDTRVHENGLVALTGSLTLLEVKDWEGGRPLTLANPGVCLYIVHARFLEVLTLTFHCGGSHIGLTEPPHAWAIIPLDQNISRHVEVLLSVDTTIFAIDNLESVNQRVAHGLSLKADIAKAYKRQDRAF
jgi:vacuolar protein sorting-associated protein 16